MDPARVVEHGHRLIERDAVLAQVRDRLRWIPFELIRHATACARLVNDLSTWRGEFRWCCTGLQPGLGRESSPKGRSPSPVWERGSGGEERGSTPAAFLHHRSSAHCGHRHRCHHSIPGSGRCSHPGSGVRRRRLLGPRWSWVGCRRHHPCSESRAHRWGDRGLRCGPRRH